MEKISRIIYVHGFGGYKPAAPFSSQLSDFIKRKQLRFDVDAFQWNARPIVLQTVIHDFLESQAAAKEAGRLLLEEIAQLETRQTNYYLIGFSLGASVIRYALEQQDKSLKHIRGIYFLGAAFDHDVILNQEVIPSDIRCYNYFSRNNDVTIKSYRNASGEYAAGAAGLTRARRFENYSTHCSHSMINSYAVLAEPISYLIAWDDQQYLAGSPNLNLAIQTMEGKVHWNEICKHNAHLIQQNSYTKHLRAINTEGKRIAWGKNLHTIFHAISPI
ncbi:DUF726 domain-containing protein [Leptolyngbya sp. AN02str]|uniref:DUF726 domain-containing protein n=1 Tax=Leptolyngbya sp. AN02str TaxID=3423363 RepID=UPI003D31B5FF